MKEMLLTVQKMLQRDQAVVQHLLIPIVMVKHSSTSTTSIARLSSKPIQLSVMLEQRQTRLRQRQYGNG